jgi:hypothetical protein
MSQLTGFIGRASQVLSSDPGCGCRRLISYDSDIFVQGKKEPADHYIFVATALNKIPASKARASKRIRELPFAFTTMEVVR